ncbi:hypothetical protein H2248_008421 [Termitomyces sp. 'cryptogamus']|nr:hypothetical protein H2248_008421 [Termitomyces sp. 'cryptogamus']
MMDNIISSKFYRAEAVASSGSLLSLGLLRALDCGYEDKVMKDAAFIVFPNTFEEFPDLLMETYQNLVQNVVVPRRERDPPGIPMNYKTQKKLGLIHKSLFTRSGPALCWYVYLGCLEEDIGLDGVVSLLWFNAVCLISSLL